MKVVLLREVGSTNDEVKKYLGGGESVIVCAERQTCGRGTKGRSFLSEQGGVYLSALTFYRDLPASRAFEIMAHAAVAVCKTAEDLGLSPEIKWANDVLLGGRKLAGILTENILSENRVKASVVGIGLNVNNDVSPLGGVACSLSEYGNFSVPAVRDRLIFHYTEESSFGEYLSRLKFLGERIVIEQNGKTFPAIARAVREDGRLEADCGGKICLFSAAEIKLRRNL